MKRVMALVLAMALSVGLFAGCQDKKTNSSTPTNNNSSTNDASKPAKTATINVVTTYAGNDANATNYQIALAGFELTGNKVNDASATSNEAFKSKVASDFSAGSEPDVLFYFTGADADSFLDKVVSIEDIRKEYPDFADNMKDDMLPKATDGKKYAVPVNGFWEGMFVNKAVLKAAGVSVPGADYTWDQFLADCQKIKDAGLTPIAASLSEIPHYWWEFAVANNDTPATHLAVPASADDAAGKAWQGGMADIKALYEKGYFPDNTLSETDENLQQLFYQGKAAFLLDGSWRAGTVKSACSDASGAVIAEKMDNFTVTYFPGKGERKATDMIGGISSGYYITKKAWDDASKRDACVQFVKYMTSDKIVSNFSGTSITALKNGAQIDESALVQMEKDAIAMNKGSTTVTGAVQDTLNQTARTAMFADVQSVVTNKLTAQKLVENYIAAAKAE